jgi:hypothetical protein
VTHGEFVFHSYGGIHDERCSRDRLTCGSPITNQDSRCDSFWCDGSSGQWMTLSSRGILTTVSELASWYFDARYCLSNKLMRLS